jgi:hypothetical protein
MKACCSLRENQNNEKTTRTSIKATIVGTAKVLSYEDIVEAQQKRDTKEAEAVIVRGRRTSKRNKATPSQGIGKRSRSHEREEAIDEIRASGRYEEVLLRIEILAIQFLLLLRVDNFVCSKGG